MFDDGGRMKSGFADRAGHSEYLRRAAVAATAHDRSSHRALFTCSRPQSTAALPLLLSGRLMSSSHAW